MHPELADAIQNSRRHEITALEREFDMRVEIIASTSLHRSEERVEWLEREPAEAASPSVPVVSAGDVAGTREAQTGGEPHTVVEKRRKRRRGGRRHKKNTPAQIADAESVPAPRQTSEGVEAAAQGTPPGGTGTRTKKRRRRKHRRSKPAPAQPGA